MDDHSRHTHGFTLIEQICVLAVLAVLLATALPALSTVLSRTRTRETAGDLVTLLHRARTAAVTTPGSTLVCPSHDSRHCASGTHWEQGWLAAYDRDHDGHVDGAPFAVGMAPGRTRVIGSLARDRIRFHPDGSAPGSNTTLLVCDNADRPRRVVLANSGRVRTAVAPRTACPDAG